MKHMNIYQTKNSKSVYLS